MNQLIKQQRVVHELFLRSIYDPTNESKRAKYVEARQVLTQLQYAETK